MKLGTKYHIIIFINVCFKVSQKLQLRQNNFEIYESIINFFPATKSNIYTITTYQIIFTSRLNPLLLQLVIEIYIKNDE